MKWLRKILKGVSLTAAMFVFQACYGPGPEYYFDEHVTFHVTDGDTGEPMEGVRVWWTYVDDRDSTVHEDSRRLVEYTDSNGMATLYTSESELGLFSFVDKDSLYTSFDTIINLTQADTVDIVLHKLD